MSHQFKKNLRTHNLCVCQSCCIWSLWSWNWHYYWIHIKKLLQKMYDTHVFTGVAIYGYSNHKSNITIEFLSKNHSRRCITLMCLPVLPYMVTLIMKQTHRHHHQKPLLNTYISYFLDILYKLGEIWHIWNPLVKYFKALWSCG